MSAPYPNAILAALESAQLGIHSGVSPRLLPFNQNSFAVNVTHRGTYPKTRPPIRKLNVTYAARGNPEDPDYESSAQVQAYATQAWFQCASNYNGIGKPNCLISAIGGRQFRYLITGNNVTVQDVTVKQRDPTVELGWMGQGMGFLISNDGEGNPLFWDGASFRESAGPPGAELPPGTAVSYVNGRFIMGLPDQMSYIAGDLVYNRTSGTSAYNYRDAILKIKDNIQILAGQAFGVPVDAGNITAIFATAVVDTSLGQGPIQIGTEEGVFGVDLPLNATLWTTLQQPSQVVSLPSTGPVSARGVPIINTDAWYRAPDGLRSFQIGRRDMNTWVQTALSFELERILPYDTKQLLKFGSGVSFNNRFIQTVSPYRVTDRGVAHRGLVALDFNNISALTSRSQPAYDGLWTGISILQILTAKIQGVRRCFMFALDADGNICLYELGYDDSSWFDWNGTENVPTQSWIETGALFNREQVEPMAVRSIQKKLITLDMFPSELAGDVEFTLSYRSDDYPFWNDWATFGVCATACETPTDCSQPQNVQLQYATYLRAPEPADTCNPITGRLYRTGYGFQIKIAWEGHALINKGLTWAVPDRETVAVACATTSCQVLKGCADDLFSYSIES